MMSMCLGKPWDIMPKRKLAFGKTQEFDQNVSRPVYVDRSNFDQCITKFKVLVYKTFRKPSESFHKMFLSISEVTMGP